MLKQLLTNIKVNLKFYRRNKLFLIIVIFIFIFLVLTLIPTLIIFIPETQKFTLIREITNRLNTAIIIIAAVFGLLTIYHHIRNRSIKMVLTKPCPTELFLLSHFLSAAIICFALYILVFFISISLHAYWKIPFQWGLLYVLSVSFCHCIIMLSFTTFLTMIIHPGIAILFVLVINEDTLYQLTSLAVLGIEKVKNPFFLNVLRGIKPISNFIYMILPSYAPFSKHISQLCNSYRVEFADLKYLFFIILYTSILFALLFLLSNDVLKSKRFI